MLALPMSPFVRYNPRLPRRVLDPREISVCTNAEIQDGGVVRSIGWSLLADLTTQKARHMAEHIMNDGTRYMCILSTNNFYVYNPSDNSLTDCTRAVGDGGNYSGSEKWSSTSYGDLFIFTNGVDAMQKWDGNLAHKAVALSGTSFRPQLVMTFGAHLMCAADNADVEGAIGLKKFGWSIAGDPTDFVSPGSGMAYVYEGSGGITGWKALTRDTIAIYKTESVHLLEYVGAPMYFYTRTSLTGVGVNARNAIASVGNEHIVLTNNGLRKFNGASLDPFGVEIDPVLDTYFPNNNYEYAQLVFDSYNNNLWLLLPAAGTDHDFQRALLYNFGNNSWSLQTGFSAYSVALMRMGTATDTFRMVFSDTLSKVYKMDPDATTRHGVVYTSTVETAMVCPGLILYQATTFNTELVQIDIGHDYGNPSIYVGTSDRGDDEITWYGPYTPDANGRVYTTVVGRWFVFRIQDTAAFSVHTLTPWFVQRGVV